MIKRKNRRASFYISKRIIWFYLIKIMYIILIYNKSINNFKINTINLNIQVILKLNRINQSF